MASDNQTKQTNQAQQAPEAPQADGHKPADDSPEARAKAAFDGLADKKPEELTPEELRLMADTMPGEGPGD